MKNPERRTRWAGDVFAGDVEYLRAAGRESDESRRLFDARGYENSIAVAADGKRLPARVIVR